MIAAPKSPQENLFLMFLSNLNFRILWIGEILHYLEIVAIKLWIGLTLRTLCTSEKHSISGNTEDFFIFDHNHSPQENLIWIFLSNLTLKTLCIGEIWHYLEIAVIKLWTDLTLRTLWCWKSILFPGKHRMFSYLISSSQAPRGIYFWSFSLTWL